MVTGLLGAFRSQHLALLVNSGKKNKDPACYLTLGETDLTQKGRVM